MIWRTDKPEGSPIVAYLKESNIPEVLLLAKEPYLHYYDSAGEEVPTGMIQKWASLSETQTPSDLDEAEFEYAQSLDDIPANQEEEKMIYDAFKAGANWMAWQVETIDGEILTTSDYGWETIRIPKKLYPLGTKVTIQIRKKE